MTKYREEFLDNSFPMRVLDSDEPHVWGLSDSIGAMGDSNPVFDKLVKIRAMSVVWRRLEYLFPDIPGGWMLSHIVNILHFFVNIFYFTPRKLLTLKFTGGRLRYNLMEELMNQTELAKKAGYSKTMLSMILSGLKRPGGLGALRLENITGIPIRLWLTGKPRVLRREVEKWIRSEN